MPTYTLTELRWMLRRVWTPRAAAVLVRGASGTAKTSTTLQDAINLQMNNDTFGVCFINASNIEGIDLRGMPLLQSGDKPASLAQLSAIPEWMRADPNPGSYRGAISNMPQVMEGATPTFYPRGIVIVDEIGQAEPGVQLVLAQLLAEKRVGQWAVPREGWAVVGLTNATSHGAGAREFYQHIISRCQLVDVTCTFADLAAWWEAPPSPSQPMLRSFMMYAGHEACGVFTTPTKHTQEAFPTPRGWYEASCDVKTYLQARYPTQRNSKGIETPFQFQGTSVLDEMNDARLGIPDDPMVAALIDGRVGAAVRIKFMDFIAHYAQAPTIQEVLNAPMTAKVPNDPFVQSALIEDFLAKVKRPQWPALYAYLGRREIGAAIGAMFCIRAQAKVGAMELVRDDLFNKFAKSCGVGARLMLAQVAYSEEE